MAKTRYGVKQCEWRRHAPTKSISEAIIITASEAILYFSKASAGKLLHTLEYNNREPTKVELTFITFKIEFFIVVIEEA